MNRDTIFAELLEIEGMLQEERLNDNDRHSLLGAQQALQWHPVSQTFYRIDQQPSEAGSLLLH